MTIHLRLSRRLAVLFFLLVAVPVFAVSRTLAIDAPARVLAGAKLNIAVTAATDAGGGEQVGFLHAEYSVDGGRTWTGFSYDERLGPRASRSVALRVGDKGTQIRVRARAAFRGGKAGDVDFSGARILWDGSWRYWEMPPARTATIEVVGL